MNAPYPRASTGRDYELLACFSFARRLTEGKRVAVVGDDAGHGTRLLAGSAASVVGPVAFPGESGLGGLRELPEAGFDVVVAPGVAGQAEGLIQEAKKILNPDGLLVVSAPDGASLVPLLEHNFREVRAYRLGAVSGAAVFEEGGGAGRATVEGVGSLRADPSPDRASSADSFLALCGDAGVPAEDVPYLTLDPDRRVFEELEDLSEEVELLRGEILRMQESEAQAFGDTLTLRTSEVNHFRSRLERSEEHVKAVTRQNRNLSGQNQNLSGQNQNLSGQNQNLSGQNQNLSGQNQNLSGQNQNLRRQLHEIQTSRTWRLLGVYRGLASRLRRG